MLPTVTLDICWGKKRPQRPHRRAKGGLPNVGGSRSMGGDTKPGVSSTELRELSWIDCKHYQPINWIKSRQTSRAARRELNKLCKEHEPLIKISLPATWARGSRSRILWQPADSGLAKALTKFEPQLGFTIGVFARYWIRGEMTALFKSHDPLALGRAKSLTVLNIDGEEEPEESHQRDVAAAPPIISPDLSALGHTDRYIINRGFAEML